MVGFRGTFSLAEDATVDLQLSGGLVVCRMDRRKFLYRGPRSVYCGLSRVSMRKVDLKKGTHTVAVQVQYESVATRILKEIQPFFYFRASVGETEIPVVWRCQRLNGYTSQLRRINPQLGWIEWVDTRQLQPDWQMPQYDDTAWGYSGVCRASVG